MGMGRGEDKTETTHPELAEHRWDIDQAEDCTVMCATRALAEMSGCGHDITQF